MNLLRLTSAGYEYDIDGKTAPKPHVQSDFVIDGVSLSKTFAFHKSRPWFGHTCFDHKEPSLSSLVRQLRGHDAPNNQFGTGRFVLYGCHCGADYCGIVSCGIERQDAIIRWTDLRYENDLDDEPMGPQHVAVLTFETRDYDAEVDRFLSTL